MRVLCLIIGVAIGFCSDVRAYEPLPSTGRVETYLLSYSYGEWEVPLKIYLPAEIQEAVPVILLSHGLGGSREIGAYLGQQWAGRGYVVVAMQHIGSDESLWKDLPKSERFKAAKQGASMQSFLDRTRDVPATIDQLEKWNVVDGHLLAGRMDLEHMGIGGHSFGAITTQAAVGQVFSVFGAKYLDKRLDAGLALSPSPPKLGSAEKAFGQISVPMMLMTGTKDGSPLGKPLPQERREVYPALPSGQKYELVLQGATHMAFSDHWREGQKNMNPNHHIAIKALSSAFWDSTLKNDSVAKEWLNSEKPKTMLEAGDLWQWK